MEFMNRVVAVMEQAEIRRESLSLGENRTALLSVANEAVEYLGYKTLQAQTTEMQPLCEALAKLEIEILNEADVREYQRLQRRDVAAQLFAKWLAQDSTENFYMPSWNEAPIDKYKEPIPEFVLAKAIQIKKAYPDAVITIQYLEEYPDPFLVVKTQKQDYYDWDHDHKHGLRATDVEKYYVEVWAEPKFERRLR